MVCDAFLFSSSHPTNPVSNDCYYLLFHPFIFLQSLLIQLFLL